MPMLRLDKFITDSGLFTRSEAIMLIKQGRVRVDGVVSKRASDKVNPELEIVLVDNTAIAYRKFVYLMLNKPSGFISATEDRAERTVMELLCEPYSKLGLFPAGRLDKDAEGFLLLTNDGGFAHRITSPNGKVSKRYFVEIDGSINGDISAEDIRAMAKGIVLGDGTKCLPAVLEKTSGGAFVTLYEGKYHQVKRMMAALGKPVNYLKRVAIGGLELDESLNLGEYREIGDELTLLLGIFDI